MRAKETWFNRVSLTFLFEIILASRPLIVNYGLPKIISYFDSVDSY